MKPAGSRSTALRNVVGVTLAAVGCGAPLDDGSALGEAAQPATFGRAGLLPTNPTVCFVVGPVANASAPSSPVSQAQVDTARNAIDGWAQGSTGLRFQWSATVSSFTAVTLDGSTYLTSCGRAADGSFTSRVRIYLDHRNFPPKSTPYPSALTVPGCTAGERRGTQKLDDAGNPVRDASGRYEANTGLWAWYPDTSAVLNRCLYTVHLATGQPLNNYLHESGHAIGLSHEHRRSDANCIETEDPEGGLFVTSYDRDSVMHYNQSCSDGTQVAGNFGTAGLSDRDRLGVEILYPTNTVARVWGSLPGWVGSAPGASSDWVARGAYVTSASTQGALSTFEWRVDGVRISTGARPSSTEWGQVTAGRHTLELRFRDFWGRAYAGSVPINVLPTRQDYLRRVAATTSHAF